VETESNRARRYPIQAYVEVVTVPPEAQLRERTTDLSLFGCHVKTVTPFSPGTEVNIQIAHGGENFGARGRVAYARPNVGMGIVFTTIPTKDRVILEDWIDSLSTK